VRFGEIRVPWLFGRQAIPYCLKNSIPSSRNNLGLHRAFADSMNTNRRFEKQGIQIAAILGGRKEDFRDRKHVSE